MFFYYTSQACCGGKLFFTLQITTYKVPEKHHKTKQASGKEITKCSKWDIYIYIHSLLYATLFKHQLPCINVFKK